MQQFQNFQPQDQGKGPQTLKIPDQLFVLYSMSTAAFAPFRGHDATSSGLRVYGTFPTRDEALHHADVISGEDNCVSLFISSSATWFLLSDDEVSVQNSEPIINGLLKSHATAQVAREQEFREHKRAALNTQTSAESDESGGQGKDGEKENDADWDSSVVTKKPDTQPVTKVKHSRRRMSAACAVMGQRLVVASFVCDPNSFDVCCKVYGMVDTEEEANAWIRNVISKSVVDQDIHVLSACEWVFPTHMANEEAPRQVFRNEELNRIMQSRGEEPKKVQDFEEWQSREDARKALTQQLFDSATEVS